MTVGGVVPQFVQSQFGAYAGVQEEGGVLLFDPATNTFSNAGSYEGNGSLGKGLLLPQIIALPSVAGVPGGFMTFGGFNGDLNTAGPFTASTAISYYEEDFPTYINWVFNPGFMALGSPRAGGSALATAPVPDLVGGYLTTFACVLGGARTITIEDGRHLAFCDVNADVECPELVDFYTNPFGAAFAPKPAPLPIQDPPGGCPIFPGPRILPFGHSGPGVDPYASWKWEWTRAWIAKLYSDDRAQQAAWEAGQAPDHVATIDPGGP